MAEEYSVTFYRGLLQKMEDMAAIKLVEKSPDFDGKSLVIRTLRCFSRHGIPVRVVLEVIGEVYKEGGANDG